MVHGQLAFRKGGAEACGQLEWRGDDVKGRHEMLLYKWRDDLAVHSGGRRVRGKA